MLDQLFKVSQDGRLDFSTVILNLILSLILVLIISWVYRKTHQGLSYSQSFNSTIIILGLLITVIMMVIGNNVAIAFGALGAFSLIRFRTAIKDTKDTAFIFFCVVIGMAVGTGNYAIAIMSTIIVSIMILTLFKFNFGSVKKFNYVLTLSSESVKSNNDKIKEIFKKYLKTDSLLNANARENGKILDLTFSIDVKKEDEIEEFVRELNGIDGITNTNLISSKSDIEY